VAPPLGGVGPLDRPLPVAQISADADGAAVDSPRREWVELSAHGRHRRLVDQGHTVIDVAHPNQGIALLLECERLKRWVTETLADVVSQPRLPKRFGSITGYAERDVGERNRLPAMRGTFDRGLLEQPFRPAQPSVADRSLEPLEVVNGKLEGHSGSVAWVALP